MSMRSWPLSKWILFSVSVIVVGFALYFFIGFILVIVAFSDFSDDCSVKDLADNYDSHQLQIEEVRRYIETIVPENRDVHIEFDGESELKIFHVMNHNPQYNVNGKHHEFNVDVDSEGAKKQLSFLNWTEQTLDTLYQKLQAANCISVETSRYGDFTANPVTIGYKRSGMGMYFYKVFDGSTNDSIVRTYSGCNYIYYMNKTILEYGGGAVGRNCFTDQEREQLY